MENKQTAVDWLVKQIASREDVTIFKKEIKIAKEMERLQLTDAQSYAISNADMTNNRGYFDCDKWYNETYGK